MGFGAILSGVGALSGFLGGGGDNGASQYRADQLSDLANYTDTGAQFGNLAGMSLADYGKYNTAYNTALGNLASYLQSDPYTSQRDAADLASATAGTTQAYQRMSATLRAQRAAAGLDTASSTGQSSVGAGQDAYLAASEANTLGGAQNQLAYNKIQQRASNLNALTQLYGGAASTAYGRGTSALGQEGSIYDNAANQYGSLANYMQQQQQQQTNGFLGLLGTAANQIGFKGAYNKALGSGVPGISSASSGSNASYPTWTDYGLTPQEAAYMDSPDADWIFGG